MRPPIDYSALDLSSDNYFLVDGGCCPNCGDDGCDHCGGTGCSQPHEADLSILLHNIAVAGALCAAYDGGWRARIAFVHILEASRPDVVWRPGCGREAP